MPTYIKYKYIFFFISISGRIRIRNIFPAEPDPDTDPWKKMSDPHPLKIIEFSVFYLPTKGYIRWIIIKLILSPGLETNTFKYARRGQNNFRSFEIIYVQS